MFNFSSLTPEEFICSYNGPFFFFPPSFWKLAAGISPSFSHRSISEGWRRHWASDLGSSKPVHDLVLTVIKRKTVKNLRLRPGLRVRVHVHVHVLGASPQNRGCDSIRARHI